MSGNTLSVFEIEKSRRRFRRNAVILVIVLLSFLSLPTLCSSHSDHHHDHHHHDQNPSFKYSRQANEHLPPVQKPHHHGHDDHGHVHHEHKAHHHTTKKSSDQLGEFLISLSEKVRVC